MSAVRKVATILGFAIGAYAVGVRPRLLQWGATDDEVRAPYPGADLIPEGTRSATFAITIDAPPDKVWPWLVQMGTDRGGWYSWDRLDNFGRHSVDQIHAEWQSIKVGDHFNALPSGGEWWEVAALEPERFLALRMSVDLRGRPFDPAGRRPRFFTDSTWCYLLKSLPGGRTRIVESGYWVMGPRWLQPVVSLLLIEPEHWVMQTRQFANLKRLAERSVELPGDGAPAPELATAGAAAN